MGCTFSPLSMAKHFLMVAPSFGRVKYNSKRSREYYKLPGGKYHDMSLEPPKIFLQCDLRITLLEM